METDVEAGVWAAELESLLLLQVGQRFTRVEPRRRMRDYVRGLLGPVGRKNGWQLIRARGPHLLEDPNVTSVDIGHKVTNGTQGKQLALRSRSRRRPSRRSWRRSARRKSPETITVDGVEVPTDVTERSYKPQMRKVAQVQSPPGKPAWTRSSPVSASGA